MTHSRTLVFYHYFEDEEARSNLTTFLHSGYRTDADFVFVLAGGCSVDLPSAGNIRYLFTANRNYDFGGYSQALAQVEVGQYDHVLFINSSVLGPFLPTAGGRSWIEAFTARLTGDVGLCGASVNILRSPSDHLCWLTGRIPVAGVAPHVQTYAYALRRDALAYLLETSFFNEPDTPFGKDAAIAHYEIELSRRLLAAGWNLDCLAAHYSGRDYRVLVRDPNPTSFNGSPLVKGGYFGGNLDPREVLFAKPKRDYVSATVLRTLAREAVDAGLNAGSSAFVKATDGPIFDVKSAWRGHRNLARWIMQRLCPRTVVDLGVDYGFSTLSFASYARDLGLDTTVYGVDTFEGDAHAGERNTYQHVVDLGTELGLSNLELIKGYFSEVARSWTRPIDVLHIDGLHTYEAVSEDFYTWGRFVSDGGLILMHDTCVPHFGVRRLFDEIDLPKLNFRIWNGLGVVSKDERLIEEITHAHSEMLEPLAIGTG